MPVDIFEQEGISDKGKGPVDIFQAENIIPEKSYSTDPAQQLKEGSSPSAIDLLRDIGGGAASDLAKGGETLNELINKIPGVSKAAGYIHNKFNLPEVNTEDVSSLVNKIKSPKSYTGKGLVQTVGGFLPYMGIGGTSKIGQVINGGVYGGLASNPGEREKNMMEGLLLNSLIFGAPTAIKNIPSVSNKITDIFKPGKDARLIINSLSKGSKNLEQNSKSLSSDIKNAHDFHVGEANKLYSPVQEKYGEEVMYPHYVDFSKPDGGAFKIKYKIPDFIKSEPASDLGKVYSKFSENPTFNNAHTLQSQLGIEIGSLEKMQKTPEIRAELSSLKNARDKLKDDMNDFLSVRKGDQAASDLYKSASDYFKENVVPYRSTKKLRDITSGKKSNIKNIHNIFEYPEENINKIVNDLPEESKDKILFSAIGGRQANAKPSNLLKNLQKSKEKGYSSYFNADLNENMNKISPKIKRLNKLKNSFIYKNKVGAGMAAGYGVNELINRKDK